MVHEKFIHLYLAVVLSFQIFQNYYHNYTSQVNEEPIGGWRGYASITIYFNRKNNFSVEILHRQGTKFDTTFVLVMMTSRVIHLFDQVSRIVDEASFISLVNLGEVR